MSPSSSLLLPLLLFLPRVVSAVCPSCQQQCPCASKTVSSAPMPCIGYDTRYMASSIDEAMFTFPNLVSSQGKPLFDESAEQQSSSAEEDISPFMASKASVRIGPAPQGASEAPAKAVNKMIAPASQSSCVSQECMSCKLAIVNGFLDSSNQKETDSLWGTKVRLQQETGLSTGTCGSAENTPPPTTTRKPAQWERNQKKREHELISVLSAYGRKKRAIPSMPNPLSNTTTDDSQGSTNSSSQSTMDALLGVTTQIGCDYRRGSGLSTNDGFSGLCNLCWQWRRLPDIYFPNYVNEVACDQSDCGCLSGFGTCMPVTRVLNVLQNIGTVLSPQWQQATIDTIASCECQVSLSSPLLSFISK